MKEFLNDVILIGKGLFIWVAGLFLIGAVAGGVDRFWAWVLGRKKDKSGG